MNSKPTMSSILVSPLPPKKRKELSLGHLSIDEKHEILNMCKLIILKDPRKKTSEIVSETVEAIGVAKSTVYRILKEYRETGKMKSSKNLGGRPRIIANFDEVKESIRQIAHSFLHKNEKPSLKKILNEVNSRSDLPNMSQSTLQKLMKNFNFKSVKMELEENSSDSKSIPDKVNTDNHISSLLDLLKNISNLGTIIKEAETLKTRLEKENVDKNLETGNYISSTKDIVLSLTSSVDKINSYYQENNPKWSSESNAVDVKPQIGSIKVIALDKLLDPNRKKKAAKSVEDVVVILSDSSDSDVPVLRRTRNKASQKRRSSNNNKENLSDDENSKNTSKSILKKRHSSDKSTKKVQFSDKNVEILSSIQDIDSSTSSSDDSDDSYKPKSFKIKEIKLSKRLARNKDSDNKKIHQKCYVKMVRIPAHKLKNMYKKICEDKEKNEIDRLCNLKTLKRPRKESNSDTDLPDSKEQQPKKKKSKNSPRPKCRQVRQSSDSDASTIVEVTPTEEPLDVQKSCSPPKEFFDESMGEVILDSIDDEEKKKGDRDSASLDEENEKIDDLDDTEASSKKKDKDDESEAPKINSDESKKEMEKGNPVEVLSNLSINDITKTVEDNAKEDKEKEKNEETNETNSEKGNKSDNSIKKNETDNEKGNNSDDSIKDGNTDNKNTSDNEAKKKEPTETNDNKNESDLDKTAETSKNSSDENESNDQNDKNGSEKSDSEKSDSDNDDSSKPKGSSKWKKDKLLTTKLSDTDSEEERNKFKKKTDSLKEKAMAIDSNDSDIETPLATKKNKRLKKKRVNRVVSDSEYSDKESNSDSESQKSSSSDSDGKKEAEKKKSRRRIKRVNDSSEDDDDKSTRKNIRKVIGRESLAESTKQAEKDEAARKARIIEKQKKYNSIFEAEKLESTKLSKVVLDFNDETEEELLKVDKTFVQYLKPHQGKGIQFMWDTCFESIERAKSTSGSGCILAHCMGLGKTLQVITLIHTLLSNKEKCGVKKVLVVCPLSTVLNWVAEFKKWIPEDDENVDVFDLVAFKDNKQRVYQTTEWHKHGGVLVLGYDMFRNLSNDQNKRLTKKIRAEFARALIDPGPDLVVCDEGHLLKNEKTSISKSMNKLRTQRRIVLTGTPLQNNLKEYWCMVQFVKPNLLGTYKEYLNRFVNPITNGQYTDSTEHDIIVMRKRSHVLHKLLDGIVQRRDYSVLAPFLPPKHEYVLFISLSKVQIDLYRHYLGEFARKQTAKRGKSFLFTDFQEFQRICTHPRVLQDKSIQRKLQKEKEDFEMADDESEGSLKDFIDDEDDSEEDTNTSSGSGSGSDNTSKSDKKQKYTRRTRALAGKEPESQTEVEEVVEEPSEWWRQHITNDELDNIKYSGKLHLLFEILHQCELMGDKVLVFSQSLYSLNVIEYFLGKIDEASQNNDSSTVEGYMGSWSLGLDYFRLDGSSSCDNRANWCKVFNDPENTRARLFLISTRAGGLGINLVAANRVIIFDASWNPSHDIQSIYRVYRFGQTKPTYVYRFITMGTMEMKVYERQVTKQAISKRVIDEQQIDRHYNQNDLAELYKFEPKDEEERPIPLVPKDVLLGELLQNFKNLIFSYHEHQSLLENKEDEVLDEAERKAAWEEFENEKTARNNFSINNAGAINNIPLPTVVAALTNIIQREHPLFTTLEINGVMPQLITELKSQMAIGDLTLYQKVLMEIRQQQTQQQQLKLQEFYQHQIMQGMKNLGGVSSLVGNPYYQRQQQQWMQQLKQNGASSSTATRPSKKMDPNEVVQIDD